EKVRPNTVTGNAALLTVRTRLRWRQTHTRDNTIVAEFRSTVVIYDVAAKTRDVDNCYYNVSKKAPTVPGLKIVIVGDCEVGKTSIYLRFLHNQFSPLYLPTKKVNIDNVVQKVNQPSHALVSLTLWDIPGREEIDLQPTYFRDMDALIVVVDLTDEASIRMAPVWKQIALNRASRTGQEVDSSVLQTPVLLLGNKFDVIEEKLLADMAATNTSENERNDGEGTEGSPQTPRRRRDKTVKVEKPGAVVSAKSGDGSVHQAITSFVRHILEKRDMPRRWQPVPPEERVTKSKDRQADTLEPVGIPQFDELFEQGQVIVTRVSSLAAHFKETLAQFQELCLSAGVVSADDNSLENCLVGLREALAKQDIKLKLTLKDKFCVLEAKSAEEDTEIQKDLRYALKSFDKEFAAVCMTIMTELPTVSTSLEMLDNKLDALCQEYKVPPPPQPGQTHNREDNTENSNNVDLKKASTTIEKNRGKISHVQHQSQDVVKKVETALKKARTAFVW
ncbi:hypothetical protein BaRGS_00008659, partial [Batillaria attramentaria]